MMMMMMTVVCPHVLRSDPRLHFLLLLPKSFLIQNGPSPCIYLPENSLVYISDTKKSDTANFNIQTQKNRVFASMHDLKFWSEFRDFLVSFCKSASFVSRHLPNDNTAIHFDIAQNRLLNWRYQFTFSQNEWKSSLQKSLLLRINYRKTVAAPPKEYHKDHAMSRYFHSVVLKEVPNLVQDDTN